MFNTLQHASIQQAIFSSFITQQATISNINNQVFPLKTTDGKTFRLTEQLDPAEWLKTSRKWNRKRITPCYIDWIQVLRKEKQLPFIISNSLTVEKLFRASSTEYSLTCRVKVKINNQTEIACVMKCINISSDWSTVQKNCCKELSKRKKQEVCCNEGWLESIAWAAINPSGYYGHINAFDPTIDKSFVILFTREYEVSLSRLFKNQLYYERIPPTLVNDKNEDLLYDDDDAIPNLHVEKTIAALAQVLLVTLLPQKITHGICHNDFKTDNIMCYTDKNIPYIYVRKILDGDVVDCLRINTFDKIFSLIDYGFSSIAVKDNEGDTLVRLHSQLQHRTDVKDMELNNLYTDVAQISHSLLTMMDAYGLISDHAKKIFNLTPKAHRADSKYQENTDTLVEMLVQLCRRGEIGHVYPLEYNHKDWETNFYILSSKKCKGNESNRPDLFDLFKPYFGCSLDQLDKNAPTVDYFEDWFEK